MENYKTLKKETADDTSKWKHILSSLIGRINIIKITLLFLNKGSIRLPITTYKQVPKTKVGGEGKRYLLKDCINWEDKRLLGSRHISFGKPRQRTVPKKTKTQNRA